MAVEHVTMNFQYLNDRQYRAAMLEVCRYFESLQHHMLVRQFCEVIREAFGLPAMGDAVATYWKKAGGIKQPITLAAADEALGGDGGQPGGSGAQLSQSATPPYVDDVTEEDGAQQD